MPADRHASGRSRRYSFAAWRLAGLLLCLGAAFSLGTLLVCGVLRVAHPFELEWMEGAVLDHARLAASGRQLYRAPSLQFTPSLYTPFYYYFLALLSKPLGLSFALARGVSLLATVGSVALIGAMVWRETRSRIAMLVAAGFFAGTYGLTGFWMDLARVDSSFLLLLLAGCYFIRFGQSSAASVAGAIALYLAFMTKQTGLFLAMPVLVLGLMGDRKRGALAAGVFAAAVIGTIVGINRATSGWFGYYVFSLPNQHPMQWDQSGELLLRFFVTPVWPWLLMAGVALRGGAEGRGARLYYAMFLAAAALSAYLGLVHRDGFVNALMPFYAALAIVGGIGLGKLEERVAKKPWQGLLARAAMLASLGLLVYDPSRALPGARDATAGRAVIDQLRQRPGRLLMLGTGAYGWMSGRGEVHAHTMAMADVFKGRDPQLSARLLATIVESVRDQRYDLIVMGRGVDVMPPEVREAVAGSYRFEKALIADEAALWPKTGFAHRPEELWVK